MGVSLFVVTREPLDVTDVIRAVGSVASGSRTSSGAVASFVGQVRADNLNKRVLRLEYEAYEPLAVKVFQRISTEAKGRWPEVTLAVHHRLGVLAIGEASIVIAAASPHRAEAFAACRYTIERVKQIAPIWKHEFFKGGDVWIEGATANPEDERAREEAYRRSCM